MSAIGFSAQLVARCGWSCGPGPDEFGSQPVSARDCLVLWEDAVGSAERICSAGEEERGHVDVQGFAALYVAVDFDIDGVSQEGPAVTVVVLDVVAVVEKVTKLRQVFVFDRAVAG
ncbi:MULTISPECIES: hypothetical protein [Streptomyces]|uniref:Uncharacterized protein n=2 Tax=Streptomyces TaxID=1883 RepID=A0ABV9IUU8_9ACTN